MLLAISLAPILPTQNIEKSLKLTKTILACLFILPSLIAFSKSPTSPYQFYGPDFDQILPFSKAELQNFKNKKIRKVEIASDDLRTVYFFNEKGQLTSNKEFWIKRNKEIVNSTTIYKHNSTGQFIVRHTTGKNKIFYDSLSYDIHGRIAHYYSDNKLLTGKKEGQAIHFGYNLQLLSSDSNNNVLVDSLDNQVILYTIDNENRIIKVLSADQTDSVSFELKGELEYTKKYWYKSGKVTAFRAGKEITYKNNLIQTETLWDKVWDGTIVVHKINYIYDQQNRLLRTENGNRRTEFYTYYDFGLPMEKITDNFDVITKIKYRYWFN